MSSAKPKRRCTPEDLRVRGRVAKLGVLVDGQWQVRVQHGSEHVHEGDVQQGRPKVPRPPPEQRGRGQPARAGALDGHAASACVAAGQQAVKARLKVVHRAALVRARRGTVPSAAALAAAAHMC